MAKAAFLSPALPRQLRFKTASQLIRGFEVWLQYTPQGRQTLRRPYFVAGMA
ncbi:MAG: hypothetical protein Q8K62_05580 [Thiobacillus sp.]|nr:hypothetical protein [Thiobacillus sp.]